MSGGYLCESFQEVARGIHGGPAVCPGNDARLESSKKLKFPGELENGSNSIMVMLAAWLKRLLRSPLAA